ncbi:MAG TPA: ethanolamine ammonia-lyase subunit EutC [Steroidobacteraceae bacterium]|jgi:ethanolamine ammonia-lyase small subunit|nr:ethanolamine ammonia-lyase subunit EutC [Steroidobacteraceae bacterium]
MKPPLTSNPGPLARLRERTPARVALGHSGAGLPTAALLHFQLDYARARDAVHESLDLHSLAAQLAGTEVIQVHSQAPDRTTYLQRPDLGRRLAPECNDALPRGPYDVAFILGDGLSARALQLHAAPTLRLILRALTGWRVAPVIIATQARVALGDDIGSCLNAAFSVMLIGERPGLSAPYSLGAYLTWQPSPGRRDHERNCISNIRPPQGLAYEEASARVVWLLHAARRMGRTGFLLKDDSAILQP